MKVVLISTYELGRQPFGLASPAAWLREAGHQVTCSDVSRVPLRAAAVREADLIAAFIPMHTATRLFLKLLPRLRAMNPRAHYCAYGLYAPLNAEVLREAGVRTIVGGEFEQALVDLAGGISPAEPVVMDRLRFRVPDRSDLPSLAVYAQVVAGGERRVAGYTEASRGCKHRCRHCPVVPVYQGAFRVVSRETVLEDVAAQVNDGARHITFGDPDFLNGPAHAEALVEALHDRWPDVTYDATIKVEHLLRHRALLPVLRRTGCLFVTSAVESLDDAVLARLEKGHTRAEFTEALDLMREAALPLAPTFIPFTPWTTLEGYRGFLRDVAAMGLADDVAPIQLAIRLLIPEGSLLLESEEVRALVGPYDARSLVYPWRNPDPEVDRLAADLQRLIQQKEKQHASRRDIFRAICERAGVGPWEEEPRVARAAIPFLTEPWYC